jgi:Tol biopolymer transport system component
VKHSTLLFFVCSFLLLVCCGGGGAGVQSETNDIVFQAYRNGNWDIYTVSPSGVNEKKLTNLPTQEYNPDWSPNGQSIVFVSTSTGKQEIFTMDSNGQNLKQITKDGGYDFPIFSPDGAKVLCQRRVNNESLLFIISTDGTSIVNITPDGGFFSNARWSSSGTNVLALKQEGNGPFLYKIAIDDLSKVKVFDHFAGPFSYSSDERWLYYRPGGFENGIYVSLDNNPFVKWIDGPDTVYLVGVRPNNLEVLYRSQSIVNGKTIEKLFLYEGQGTIGRELKAFGQSIQSGTWSKNGKFIMFNMVEGNDIALYGMNWDGTGVRKLSSNFASVGSWR